MPNEESENTQRTKVVLVTPEWATEKLPSNTRNRPLSERIVNAYAVDMQNGNWLLNHQGIAFNTRGELIDGQHRLHAVIKSGVSVWMNVTYNCSDKQKNGVVVDVMDTVDRGKVRGVGHQLALFHGIKAGNTVAAICRGIADFFLGYSKALSTAQTLHVYRIYEKDIVELHSIPEAMTKLRAYVAAPLVMAHNSIPEVAFNFATQFLSLEGLTTNSPVRALIKWLDHHPMAAHNKITTQKAVLTCLRQFELGEGMTKVYATEEAKNWLLAMQKNNQKRVLDLVTVAKH